MLFPVRVKWQWKLKNDQQTAGNYLAVLLKRFVVLGIFFATEDNYIKT